MNDSQLLCSASVLHYGVIAGRSDRRGHLVVLRIEASRAGGHAHLHTAQEERSDLFSARLSPRLNVLALVDRRQVGRRRHVYVRLTNSH